MDRKLTVTAVIAIIAIIAVGGSCYYLGGHNADDPAEGDGPGLSVRDVRIGDEIGMVCSFPGTSNDTVYVKVTVTAYEDDKYVVSVIADGTTRTMSVYKEDLTLEYPDESMYYFGHDTITTAFGEVECEVYSVDYQGSQMRVWYHDGIGLKVDTTVDGVRTVLERVSIPFVTATV